MRILKKKGTGLTTVICAVALAAVLSFSFKARDQGRLTIFFDHYVGNEPLRLDDGVYKNAAGQTYTVTELKYYIGNISLLKADGERNVFKGYYLVNEEDEPSKKICISGIPAGQYTGIEFTLGVDSADNCGGAQSGALDPVNAMFWAWNTGYIFLKMEGKAAASASPGHIFEYHIGGYREPCNCIRHIALTFAAPLTVNEVGGELRIKADAGKILSGSTAIDFSRLSSVTDFHNATTIADNYAGMFFLK